MTSSRVLFVIVALAAVADAAKPVTMKDYKAGKAADAQAKQAADDNESKMAAVNKVIAMMSSLQSQVVAEGEDEAATYNKVACFCKTTIKTKSADIKEGTSSVERLSTNIDKLSKERDALEKDIASLGQDIENANKAKANAKSKHQQDLAVYGTNRADMKSAVDSLKNAIGVMKAGKSSLVQIQAVSKTVRQAVLMADALGLASAEKAANAFLQDSSEGAPAVEMEDYKFHSSSVIKTLEELNGDFRKQSQDLDAAEAKRVASFQMFMQMKTDLVTAKTHEMTAIKQVEHQDRIKDIGNNKAELATTQKQLDDDKAYLEQTNEMSKSKAATYDQRSKARSEELVALTQALEIIKGKVAANTGSSTMRLAQTAVSVKLADAVAASDPAMEAIEAEAEMADDASAPVGFLQKKSVKSVDDHDRRQLIIALLKGKAGELHSVALTALASQIAVDPLAKVKKLVQELVERLLTEAANEASQKGWCDKALADAGQKRQYAADQVSELNARLAKGEALRDKLNQDLDHLHDQVSELKDNVAQTEANRKAEKGQHATSVKEATEGQQMVKMAIDLLDKFYKTKANEAAAADVDDAYAGNSAAAGGIIGMMEVISSDFQRTIQETQQNEADAEKEHLHFMTESESSLAEKAVATKETRKLKDEAEEDLENAHDSLGSQTKILKTSISEIMELQAPCIDTGKSYDDRIGKREQEIQSLKKAMCLLGSEGLGEACADL